MDSAMDKLEAAHNELAELTLASSTGPGIQLRRRLHEVLSNLEDSLIILRLTHPR